MPLKFLHNTDKTGADVPLALLCRLKHENSTILPTCAAFGSTYCGLKQRPMRSSALIKGTLPNYGVEATTLLCAPLLPARCPMDFSSSDGERGYAPGTEADFARGELKAPSLPKLHVGTAAQWLFLRHEEIPLVFTVVGRNRSTVEGRADLLQRVFAGSNISNSWHESLAAFYTAARVVVSPPPTAFGEEGQNTTPSVRLGRPNWPALCSPDGEQSVAVVLEQSVIPITSLWASSYRRLQFVSSLLHSPEHQAQLEVVFGSHHLEPSVEALQCYFKHVTAYHSTNCVSKEITEQPPPIGLRVEGGNNMPYELREVEAVCKKLQRVIVPCTTYTHDWPEALEPERRIHRRRRHAKRGGFLRRRAEPVVVPTISQGAELKFPEGKYLRQTLTFRNTAADRVREAVNSLAERGCDRPSCRSALRNSGEDRFFNRRCGMELWLSKGISAAQRCAELVATFMAHEAPHLSEGLPAVGRAVDCEGKGRAAQLYPLAIPGELPSLQWNNAGISADSVPGLGCRWLPLSVVINSDCGCGVSSSCANCSGSDDSAPQEAGSTNVVMFPPRVFSRLEELRSFNRLRNAHMNQQQMPLGTLTDGGEGHDMGEVWCSALYEHDMCTMPLPYRETAAVADDARLHYCYRLALHREGRRLGLELA